MVKSLIFAMELFHKKLILKYLDNNALYIFITNMSSIHQNQHQNQKSTEKYQYVNNKYGQTRSYTNNVKSRGKIDIETSSSKTEHSEFGNTSRSAWSYGKKSTQVDNQRNNDGGNYAPRNNDGGNYAPRNNGGGNYAPRNNGGGNYAPRNNNRNNYRNNNGNNYRNNGNDRNYNRNRNNYRNNNRNNRGRNNRAWGNNRNWSREREHRVEEYFLVKIVNTEKKLQEKQNELSALLSSNKFINPAKKDKINREISKLQTQLEELNEENKNAFPPLTETQQNQTPGLLSAWSRPLDLQKLAQPKEEVEKESLLIENEDVIDDDFGDVVDAY